MENLKRITRVNQVKWVETQRSEEIKEKEYGVRELQRYTDVGYGSNQRKEKNIYI